MSTEALPTGVPPMPAAIRRVRATRYVTAFREGGSLPGLVEADDHGLYVVKFKGAGQGPRALVAEWLGGEIARAIGLLVPEIVSVDLVPIVRRTRRSAGWRPVRRWRRSGPAAEAGRRLGGVSSGLTPWVRPSP